MTFDPIAADLAVRAARATAGSARPDAPVVPDPEAPFWKKEHGPDGARWVEPRPRPAKVCQPS